MKRSTNMAPVSLSISYLMGSPRIGISMITLQSLGTSLPAGTRSRLIVGFEVRLNDRSIIRARCAPQYHRAHDAPSSPPNRVRAFVPQAFAAPPPRATWIRAPGALVVRRRRPGRRRARANVHGSGAHARAVFGGRAGRGLAARMGAGPADRTQATHLLRAGARCREH